jgi:hypothetical protein
MHNRRPSRITEKGVYEIGYRCAKTEASAFLILCYDAEYVETPDVGYNLTMTPNTLHNVFRSVGQHLHIDVVSI